MKRPFASTDWISPWFTSVVFDAYNQSWHMLYMQCWSTESWWCNNKKCFFFLWVLICNLHPGSWPGCICRPPMRAAAEASPVRGACIFWAWYIFPATGCSLQGLLEFLQIPWNEAVAAPLHREDGDLARLLNWCGPSPTFSFQWAIPFQKRYVLNLGWTGIQSAPSAP